MQRASRSIGVPANSGACPELAEGFLDSADALAE
jgi:hypothetical protein